MTMARLTQSSFMAGVVDRDTRLVEQGFMTSLHTSYFETFSNGIQEH